MNEGVIKFNIAEWRQTSPLSEKLWREVEAYRDKFYKLKLIGFDKNFSLGFGNISVRLTGNEFIITGSQTGQLSVLNGEHYSIIKSVDFKTNSVVCEGYIKPSSESITHAACYYSNNRIKSVIHIHSKKLWEKMIENSFLSTPDSAEYGSVSLSESIKGIAENFDGKSIAVVMKGHPDGIIFAGEDIKTTADFAFTCYNSYK